MNKIKKVVFLEDFSLKVQLESGQNYVYDMKPKLKTVRFYDLSDWGMFSKGYIRNNQAICWDNGTELYLDEIIPAGEHI